MNHAQTDAFFRVPTTTHTTSVGDVDLPILYFDVSVVDVFFLCDRSAVASKLEGTGLEPALLRGDRAVVAMAFFEYRHTSIGPYNEVGLAVPALRSGAPKPTSAWLELLRAPRQRRVGFRVIDLPVTTDAACVAGRELWGYPKFVTEIPFTWQGRRFRSSVMDPDADSTIVTLAGDFAPGAPMPPFSLLDFDHVDGQDLNTAVDVRGWATLGGAGGLRLEVGASRHPMAQNLRDLGLESAKPVAVIRTQRFQSRLNAGDPAGG